MVKYMVVFVGRLDRMIYIQTNLKRPMFRDREDDFRFLFFFYVAFFTKLGSITLKQSFTSK